MHLKIIHTQKQLSAIQTWNLSLCTICNHSLLHWWWWNFMASSLKTQTSYFLLYSNWEKGIAYLLLFMTNGCCYDIWNSDFFSRLPPQNAPTLQYYIWVVMNLNFMWQTSYIQVLIICWQKCIIHCFWTLSMV